MTNALDFFKPSNLFSFGSQMFNNWFDNLSVDDFTNSPKVNVKETDKAYEIEIANPGFSKDETTIEVKDNVLYVSMTSESKEGENDGDKYHCKQWSKTSFQENWNLPENVIEDLKVRSDHTLVKQVHFTDLPNVIALHKDGTHVLHCNNRMGHGHLLRFHV